METQRAKRKHLLLTQEIREKLPPLYNSEKHPEKEAIAMVKFFSPYSHWTWYAVEFDGEDTFWGLVDGFEMEWGTQNDDSLHVGPIFSWHHCCLTTFFIHTKYDCFCAFLSRT